MLYMNTDGSEYEILVTHVSAYGHIFQNIAVIVYMDNVMQVVHNKLSTHGISTLQMNVWHCRSEML